MAKAAQEVQESPDVDQNVVAGGFATDTTEPAPAGMNKQDIQQIVSQEMAAALATMMPALLPELLKGMQIQGPNGPSATVSIGLVNESPVKPAYLKHYRRDDTVSGKYQLIDVSKLPDPNSAEIPVNFHTDHNNHTRSESPAIIKGKWIHFINGHFYATTQQEVDCIEWMQRTQPNFRVYEDNGPGIFPCPVHGCSFPGTSDESTLRNHMKYTHGVDNA